MPLFRFLIAATGAVIVVTLGIWAYEEWQGAPLEGTALTVSRLVYAAAIVAVGQVVYTKR